MTRLFLLIIILPFVLMALSITFLSVSKDSGLSEGSSDIQKSFARALSIAAGGFGFMSILLIITLILLDEDSINLYYNILLLLGYGFVLFKAQMYTIKRLKNG